jgi:hypothetical protein
MAQVGIYEAVQNAPVTHYFGSAEGNVVYHASGENESCFIFRFKKLAAIEHILLELKGAKLHQAYYTELQRHLHDAGTLAGSQPTHQHADGTLAGTQPNHQHGSVTYGTAQTSANGNDAVAITGNVASGGGDAVAIGGGTAQTGIGTEKTYPSALKVYIDGVDKTAEILTKCGLGALGDGTAGHAFVTTGTGEMDIIELITDGFHEIKISEPTSNKGGRCLLHMESY